MWVAKKLQFFLLSPKDIFLETLELVLVNEMIHCFNKLQGNKQMYPRLSVHFSVVLYILYVCKYADMNLFSCR